jgi:hypothetical protein
MKQTGEALPLTLVNPARAPRSTDLASARGSGAEEARNVGLLHPAPPAAGGPAPGLIAGLPFGDWTIGNGSDPHPQIATVSLMASQDSPQPVGTRITWTATAINIGNNPLYRFSIGAASGPLHIVQDFSPANTYTWSPMQEGVYDITATAVGDGGDMVVKSPVVIYNVNPRVTGTDPVVSGTGNPLVGLYSAPPSSATTMHIEFRPVGDPGAWMSTGETPVVAGLSTNILVAGMFPDTTYEMVGVTDLGRLPTVTFTTGPLPGDLMFPQFTVVQPPGPGSDLSQNIVLHMTPLGVNPHVNLLATDLSGRVDWYYDAVAGGINSAFATSLVPGGTLLMMGWSPYVLTPNNDLLREIDLAGNTLRETSLDATDAQLLARGDAPIYGFHHDAQRLADGRTAVLGETNRIIDVNGTPTVYVGDMVIVLDEDFQVVWTWNAFDHLDVNRLPTLDDRDPQGNVDWLLSNAIAWSPVDDDLLVSMRSQDWVVKIDYANGNGDGHVVWRLGQDGDFTLHSTDPQPVVFTSAQRALR